MEFRKDSILDVFKKYNAFLEGHFLLSSGLHSDKYIQCALVLQYPDIAEQISMLLFEEIRANTNLWQQVTAVVAPALGGVIIGHEIARVIKTFTQKQIRFMFTERSDDGKMTLRRNFEITPSDKVVIVEDVVTTGKSTNEVIEVVKSFGGDILFLCSIFNRSKNLNFPYPYYFLSKIDVNNYEVQDCPLCKQNIPLIKPGSRKIFNV